MIDPAEAEIMAGAISAPRRRATRQLEIAKDRPGSGEAVVARRVAEALFDLVDEFERCPSNIAAT